MLTFSRTSLGATGFTCVGDSTCLPDTDANEAKVRALQTLINQILAKGGVVATPVTVDGNIDAPTLGAFKAIMKAYALGTTDGLDAEILALGLTSYTTKLNRALTAAVPGAPKSNPPATNTPNTSTNTPTTSTNTPNTSASNSPQVTFDWWPYSTDTSIKLAAAVGGLLGVLLVLRRR